MYIALKEVYFGKSKNLLECEKLIAELKVEYDNKYMYGGQIECDNRIKILSNKLAQEFGLKKFILEFESMPVGNACTPPLSWGIDCMPACRMKANLIVDKSGFKYRPEAGYILDMVMYTGLFCNPDMTAGEVLAVILHEIGHNFSSVIDETCFMLIDVVHWSNLMVYIMYSLAHGNVGGAVGNALIPFVSSNAFKDLTNRLDEFVSQYKPMNYLYAIFNALSGSYNAAMLQLNYLIASILGYANAVNPAYYIDRIMNGIVKIALNPIGYRDERIADNFATAYGYGPELSTALLKLDTTNYEKLPLNKLANYIPPIGMFLRTGIGLSSIIGSMFDPHPQTMERCLDQVRYLRKELDHIHDKETKAHIKNQIDTIEKNMETLIKDPQLLKHWDIVSYSMAYIVYTSGGDVRHNVFGRDVHATMQKTYDENIGKKKFNKPKLI